MTQSANKETTAARRTQRMAWLWFGPLVVLGLLRFWLSTRAETLPDIEPIAVTHYVQTIAGHDAAAMRALMWQASQPLLISVAALAVVILIAWRIVRRWGWRRAGIAATALWCVVCAGTALTLIARYVNHANLRLLPPVTATVIAAQPYPTSESGPGGALTWLQPPSTASADGTPWLVRIENADFQAMPAGTHITLQRAHGALWGMYLTGSDAPQAQPLSGDAPAPAPGLKPSQAQPADPS